MRYLALYFIFAIIHNCISQDSLIIKTSFDVDVVGKHIPFIYSDQNCISCERFLFDNPLYHFAVYSNTNLNLSLNEKHTFKLGLLAEHRGYSFGNNTLSSIRALPYVHIRSRDTLNIFGGRFHHELVAGDMWQEDVDDITRFYNIDFQGVYSKIGQDNWRIGLFVIADLSRSIGLELGELHRLSFEYKLPSSKLLFSAGSNILIQRNLLDERQDFVYSLYYKKKFATLEIIAQADLRDNRSTGISPAAALTISYPTPLLKIGGALRYYSADYNQGYKFDNLHYRSNQNYPLKNYDRPLSQWALFSDLQESNLVNVEITAQRILPLSKQINFQLQLDTHLIYDITNQEATVLPAYNLLFHFYSVQGLRFEAGVTNKHMTLVQHFQTSALSRLPYFTYGFRLDLDGIRKKKEVLRL